MINFAWSNPVTGVREQTAGKAPCPAGWPGNDARDAISRLYCAEARGAVWLELQLSTSESAPVWIQTPIGSVDAEGDHVNIEAAQWASERWPNHQFAYTDPKDGTRHVVKEWPSKLRECWQGDSVPFATEIIMYATMIYAVVNRSDDEPSAVLPEVSPAAPIEAPRRDLAALRSKVEEIYPDDASIVCAKATALALLDIAESMRRFSANLPFDIPPALSDRSILKELDLPPIDICSCTGDGIRANGESCSCEAGRERARAEAVAKRPIWGTGNRETPDVPKDESGQN